jgi:hypothetical protein
MNWLVILAADEPVKGPPAAPDPLILGLLPRPLAVGMAIILAVSYVVADLTGKLGKLGPIYAHLRKRRQEKELQTSGWRERDAEVLVLKRALERERLEKDHRVRELRESMEIMDGQVGMLKKQQEDFLKAMDNQRRQLQAVHHLGDRQFVAIQRHIEWDRLALQKAREAGIELPEPPSLYIRLEEVDPL